MASARSAWAWTTTRSCSSIWRTLASNLGPVTVLAMVEAAARCRVASGPGTEAGSMAYPGRGVGRKGPSVLAPGLMAVMRRPW